jgi:antitoxin component of RelBE/YafQ-DinJ toxin-antitoxin module
MRTEIKYRRYCNTTSIEKFPNTVIEYRNEIPNKETVEAINELENSKDLKSYSNVEELFKDLGI